MPTVFNVRITRKHLAQPVITLIPDHLLGDILVTRKGSFMTSGFEDVTIQLP